MKIISGKNRGTNLYSVPAKTSRPTTSYIKEIIFDVLFDCNDLLIIDLFAGSGSLGLEALSRGAKFVEFVDASEKAIRTIYKNIEKLGYVDETKIHKKRVSAFLKKYEGEKIDIIFMDPPYDKGLINAVIEEIINSEILSKEGQIVIEHSSKEKIKVEFTKNIFHTKKNGNTVITFMSLEERNEDI